MDMDKDKDMVAMEMVLEVIGSKTMVASMMLEEATFCQLAQEAKTSL